MTVFQTLEQFGLPIAYGLHTEPVAPPYLVLTGQGQEQIRADNTYYVTREDYNLEYYFKEKDPDTESSIEALLLSMGRLYTKSEDIFIEDEDLFCIYYSF